MAKIEQVELTIIEQAELRLQEASEEFKKLTEEAELLPAQIAQAAQAGDLEKLTRLQQRQADMKPALIIATVSNRKRQIEVFEAQQFEALGIERQAVQRKRDEWPKLQEEEQQLIRRLSEIKLDGQRLSNGVDDAQKVAREIAQKIKKAQDELQNFIQRSSQPVPMVVGEPMRVTA